MTSSNFPFPEGNSINRPPIFNGNATIEKPREQWDEEERKMAMATKSNNNCRIKRSHY